MGSRRSRANAELSGSVALTVGSYFASALDALTTGRNLRGEAKRRTRTVLGHAIAFSTWTSLVREQELEDREVVELMCALADAATAR